MEERLAKKLVCPQSLANKQWNEQNKTVFFFENGLYHCCLTSTVLLHALGCLLSTIDLSPPFTDADQSTKLLEQTITFTGLPRATGLGEVTFYESKSWFNSHRTFEVRLYILLVETVGACGNLQPATSLYLSWVCYFDVFMSYFSDRSFSNLCFLCTRGQLRQYVGSSVERIFVCSILKCLNKMIIWYAIPKIFGSHYLECVFHQLICSNNNKIVGFSIFFTLSVIISLWY